MNQLGIAIVEKIAKATNAQMLKCSNSKMTQADCRTLDGKSWKNDETGDCIDL
jgi:Ulp1 family protease